MIEQDSLVVVKQVAEAVHRMMVETYITPFFAIALFVGNAFLWLPELLIPYKPWRNVLLRFYTDDDLKLNKSDLKDGIMVTVAWECSKFAIHFGTYDVLANKNHNELIYQLFGAAAIFLGINAASLRAKPETKVTTDKE